MFVIRLTHLKNVGVLQFQQSSAPRNQTLWFHFSIFAQLSPRGNGVQWRSFPRSVSATTSSDLRGESIIPGLDGQCEHGQQFLPYVDGEHDEFAIYIKLFQFSQTNWTQAGHGWTQRCSPE